MVEADQLKVGENDALELRYCEKSREFQHSVWKSLESKIFSRVWKRRFVMIPKKSTCLEFIRPVFTLHPPELTISTRIILKQCADFTSPLHLFIINCEKCCIEVKFRRNPKRSPPSRLRWWYRYTLAPSHGPWSIGLRLWEGSKWSFNEDKHQQNRGCQAERSSQTPHLF